MRLCDASESDDTTFNVADAKMEILSENIDVNEVISNELIPNETLVAALTVTAEGSKEWILARIKGFEGNVYVVEDAEVEEEPSLEIVQKEYIIEIYIFLK